MLFYLDAYSESIQEFLSREGEYIGALGIAEAPTLKKDDISLEQIQKHQANGEFLICSIMNGSWWLGILFNTPEGAAEIKAKYKGKPLLWYWLKRDKLEHCMHHMQLKNFNLEFPKE